MIHQVLKFCRFLNFAGSFFYLFNQLLEQFHMGEKFTQKVCEIQVVFMLFS